MVGSKDDVLQENAAICISYIRRLALANEKSKNHWVNFFLSFVIFSFYFFYLQRNWIFAIAHLISNAFQPNKSWTNEKEIWKSFSYHIVRVWIERKWENTMLRSRLSINVFIRYARAFYTKERSTLLRNESATPFSVFSSRLALFAERRWNGVQMNKIANWPCSSLK